MLFDKPSLTFIVKQPCTYINALLPASTAARCPPSHVVRVHCALILHIIPLQGQLWIVRAQRIALASLLTTTERTACGMFAGSAVYPCQVTMFLTCGAVGTQPEYFFLASCCCLVRQIAQGSIANWVPLTQQKMIAVSQSGMSLTNCNASATFWASSSLANSVIDASSPYMAAGLTPPDS